MNYQVIESGRHSSVIASYLRIINKKNDDGEEVEYIRASFPRTKWALFENKYYNSDVKGFISQKKETLEHYQSITQIPKYVVLKNGKKIGVALPRITDEDEEKFLFLPKTYRSSWHIKTNSEKYAIMRNYYIYDIADDFTINDNALLLFYQ